uniref:DUF974-domain-containing protein n=1 Tax=Mycena chlorophos TaxID=658473 RepID=A0ABQ0LWW6_MYCCL|nr:predicted protein [Mycena chlorophos]
MSAATQEEGAFQALFNSFAMIIASEIGDKTFLIAAILAMRHPRFVVFCGAFGSLVVMSILSAEMGHILPTLIPKKWTQAAAAALFLVFGGKMLMEGRAMKAGNDKIQEEMKEAEEEIEGDDAVNENGPGAIPLEDLEAGTADTAPTTPKTSSSRSALEGARNFCSFFLGPVFVQAFVLTFLGEWGDRSQIATIALGAAHNVYFVTAGTIFGHSCCTALAVIGGRYVSTKISVKHVTLGGSFLFLLFGFIYIERHVSIVFIIVPLAFCCHDRYPEWWFRAPAFSQGYAGVSPIAGQCMAAVLFQLPILLRALNRVHSIATRPNSAPGPPKDTARPARLGTAHAPRVVRQDRARRDLLVVSTASSKVLLGEFGGAETTLRVGDALEDAVVHHEVKELGQHVLACTVTYRLPAGSRAHALVDDGTDPNVQSFRKFYKFAVTNPLSVKTKVHVPRAPSALLSRTEREKIFLEVHIQNLTTESLWFERMRFEAAEGWDALDANVIDVDKEIQSDQDATENSIFSGSMSLMQPQDMRQYIYILSRPPTVLTPPTNAPGSVIPLGRLDISWRLSYGEPGRLLTSMLSRKIPLISPPMVQPAPALPPHLKRGSVASGPNRPHSPQMSMSRPDSPSRPGSPFRNRPPSSVVSRAQTPPPHMHQASVMVSDVETSLFVREIPHDEIRLQKPFKIALTLVVSAPVAPGRKRSLRFAVQHLQPPRTLLPAISQQQQPPPAPEPPYSPRITSPGFATPSPMSATFNVHLAHQKLVQVASPSAPGTAATARLPVLPEVLDPETWALPPPFFDGADELSHVSDKPGALFCGASALVLDPIELVGDVPAEDEEDDSKGKIAPVDGSREFELQYMPVLTGFTPVGGLRAILLEDKYVGGEDDKLLLSRAEPKILKQWDVVAEIWVST